MKNLPKHPYYRPLKNWPNYHYYRPQKNEEIAEKKVVPNILTNLKILIFFEFSSKNVLKTLLMTRETTRKKYRIVFEKYTFLDKKLKKSAKKNCSKFFEKFNFFNFFDFFSENVFKTLVRGKETSRNKYRIVFDMF